MLGNVLRVYSSFDNNPEIFVRKEIYAPKLFIVRVRTVLLWRRLRDSNPRGLAPKRFSRPPRYDRFDKPPFIAPLSPDTAEPTPFIVHYFLFIRKRFALIYPTQPKNGVFYSSVFAAREKF